MNVKNNKRKRQSMEKIRNAFIQQLQIREVNEISVSDICKAAELNRSTFYANYMDIYDLAEKTREHLESDFSKLFPDDQNHETDGAVRMFRYIQENQLFYKAYFKLCRACRYELSLYEIPRAEREFGGRHIQYHIEFFRSGLNAIIRLWLDNGCLETPEEMAEILKSEYRGRE